MLKPDWGSLEKMNSVSVLSQAGGHRSARPPERRRRLLVPGGGGGSHHASRLLHQEPGGLSGQEMVDHVQIHTRVELVIKAIKLKNDTNY